MQQAISTTRLTSGALTLGVILALGLATAQSALAQTFTVLYAFTGSSDGGYPYAGLVRDAAGNLYGTTFSGGASNYGVVFKLAGTTETVLHSFAGGNDGIYSYAGLIRDSRGNLYGTTYEGGSTGYGTVFKVNSNGIETVLYTFAGGTADGCYPAGGLLRDKAGNLYGTTGYCGASDVGTVFKLSKSGKETVLHSFAGGSSDGAYPAFTSLIMAKKGKLYGVTEDGGTGGEGVLYVLNSSGTLTLLHSFTGGTADGCYPLGTPAMDKHGNLYGTTEGCGASDLGLVWKVSKKGTETLLHSFAGGASDGAAPLSSVILDAKGNLFGDTQEGGASGVGTVYELSKKGTLIVLHSFSGSDGDYLFGGVIQDAKGNLYGTAPEGGSSGYGTVWKITK